MCVLFRRISGSSVLARPPFRRSHGISFKTKIVLVLVFFCLGFSSPCTVCRMGMYTPSPLQCACACSERIPSRLYSACIFGTYTFDFRVHATRALFVFLFFLDTLAFQWLKLCTAIDRSSLLSFWEKSARERLVRVMTLDPTVSVQSYLVAIRLVSVIASWPSDVAPPSLSSRLQKRFNGVVCLVSSLLHS